MSLFKVNEWEPNASADKTCNALFAATKAKPSKKQRKKKATAKEDPTFNNIKQRLDEKLKEVEAKKAKVTKPPLKSKQKVKNEQPINPAKKHKEEEKDAPQEDKPKRNKLKKLDFFGVKQQNNKSKRKRKLDVVEEPLIKKTKHVNVTLREKMMDKLRAARFRYLNEQMYTSEGNEAKKYFEENNSDYKAYHIGYRQQVAKWPINPLDIIISNIKRMPKDRIIADFGCGEAVLSKSVTHQVHSFDLVALNNNVVSCDMSHVPLEAKNVDVVVFCLSLMGTNLTDYLLEANRVLKIGGILKIAEVASRFDNIDEFINNMKKYGFSKIRMDFSHNLFYFLDFVKKSDVKKKRNLSSIKLKPCLYKKR